MRGIIAINMFVETKSGDIAKCQFIIATTNSWIHFLLSPESVFHSLQE